MENKLDIEWESWTVFLSLSDIVEDSEIYGYAIPSMRFFGTEETYKLVQRSPLVLTISFPKQRRIATKTGEIHLENEIFIGMVVKDKETPGKTLLRLASFEPWAGNLSFRENLLEEDGKTYDIHFETKEAANLSRRETLGELRQSEKVASMTEMAIVVGFFPQLLNLEDFEIAMIIQTIQEKTPDFPTCPICLNTNASVVIGCRSGHGFCEVCVNKFEKSRCPLDRYDFNIKIRHSAKLGFLLRVITVFSQVRFTIVDALARIRGTFSQKNTINKVKSQEEK